MTKNKFGFKPFIFVETDFQRKNEPIFALAAMESTRRIQIQNEIRVLPLDQQIPLVNQIICNHFLNCGGELPMWGEISGYRYFYTKDQSIVMDVNGSVIAQGSDIPPPTANVKLKGKELFKAM